MNSKHIIITLFALLSLFSVLAYANTKPNGLPAPIYPDLRSPIDKKIAQLDTLSSKVGQMSAEIDQIKRTKGGATVTVSKNYPVVPYDPNHPNVKKQSSFSIKANAKTLANRFARGANAVALGYAVIDLLGDGIDWVLDAENHQIVYNIPEGDNCKYNNNFGPISLLAPQACRGMNLNFDKYVYRGEVFSSGKYRPLYDARCTPTGSAYIYCGYPSPEEQTVSLDTLASHVISNESNNDDYHGAVTDTLVEQITNGDHDSDIKSAIDKVGSSPNNNPSSDTGSSSADKTDSSSDTDVLDLPDNVPDIGREDTPFELPEFCDWAEPVCDFIDWIKKEPNADKDTNVDIDENIIDFKPIAEKSYIVLPKTCPPNPKLSFSIPFVAGTQTLEFPLHIFCEAFALFKVVIILFAYIRALAIVGEGL